MFRYINFGRRKLINNAKRSKRIILKSIIQQGWGTSKSDAAQRIFGGAPKVGEKDVALRVDEKQITPLHAPGNNEHLVDLIIDKIN